MESLIVLQMLLKVICVLSSQPFHATGEALTLPSTKFVICIYPHG